MTVHGTASAAATSVAIPPHAAGDLILVCTRATANPVAGKPTAGGTVPNWVIPQGAGANSLSLQSAWALATTSTTTTGTWSNAAHIAVVVLRPDAGKTLAFGLTSTTNAATGTVIVYPALTLTTTAGTSWGVRVGARASQPRTEVGTPPTGWTNRLVEPAGASALMAVHTLAGLVAHPTADTVSMTTTNTAYRAHTLEVLEIGPGQQPMVTIA